MTFFNPRLLIKSFRYAIRGLTTVWRQEQNFRLQTLAASLVILLMAVVGLERWEVVALFIIITLILVLELLNSMIEKLADILEPRIHTYVRVIKDLMAALVLLASVLALIVGLIIFIPHFL